MLNLAHIYVVASATIFLLGLLAGWFAKHGNADFSKSNLRIAVAIIVTIVWAGSVTAQIFVPTFTVSTLVHGIMGAVVGYLFSDNGITLNFGK